MAQCKVSSSYHGNLILLTPSLSVCTFKLGIPFFDFCEALAGKEEHFSKYGLTHTHTHKEEEKNKCCGLNTFTKIPHQMDLRNKPRSRLAWPSTGLPGNGIPLCSWKSFLEKPFHSYFCRERNWA